LTAVAHMNTKKANGITKAINLTTNISSLLVYLMNGKVLIPLGLTAGVFGILGNYLGATLFAKKDAKFVKPVMIAVIAIFIVKLVTELF
ncbi:MAG: TSUP family transporter, partial [Clostridia bacterium]|nr:TSUP family transporter [Clostridia bacterium]